MTEIHVFSDGTVLESDRDAVIAQQFNTASMGRDYQGCTRITSGKEVGLMRPEDLCTGTATFLIDYLDYRCGMTTGGRFSPMESINSRVCGACRSDALRMPGFLRDRPIGVTA